MSTQLEFLPACVAELQGLYGAFSFPEKLLQKIWLRGDFARASSRTADGRALRIVHPGKWNLLGGPDFLGARLRFDDGAEQTGDVEVHLHASDWVAHAHAMDPAYDRVMLHVVLFPPETNAATLGAGGRIIPVLTLLPLLHHALEEYAAEEAVELLANRALTRLPEELGRLPAPELLALLRRHATQRWQQKVHFAHLRWQRLGWSEACHHTALEILGYRFNRAPMLRVAGQWPLARWSPESNVEEIYAAEAGGWSLQGVRPANQPRSRLRQYAAWVRTCPAWPDRLFERAEKLPAVEVDCPTREARRAGHFPIERESLAQAIGAGGIGGTRLDTLVCDGLLPLLAARTGRAGGGLWHHWFPGDLPPLLTNGLRQLGVHDGRGQPACHGLAQGLLGWLLEREMQATRPERSLEGSAAGRGA
jgi:hypothetical protein